MQEALTPAQKLQWWQELESHYAQAGMYPGMQETVAALHALGIHVVEASGGYPDKEPAFPYVKVAISGYAEEAQRVEQADKEAKRARNLLARFQAGDENKKAELQAQVPSREEVMCLEKEAAEMRRVFLEKHLPMLKSLLSHLSAFYKDRTAQTVSFDRYLVVTKNGLGRVILRSQGAILQTGRTPEEQLIHLHEYQDEMKAFTAFLKRVYLSSEEQ